MIFAVGDCAKVCWLVCLTGHSRLAHRLKSYETRMERDMGDPLALAACPICYEGIRLSGTIYVGRRVVCPDCGTNLVVIQGDPDTEMDAAQPARSEILTTRQAREHYANYSGLRAADHLGE